MTKLFLAALLACALGNSARAANVDAEAEFTAQFTLCLKAGGWRYGCLMEHLPEAKALQLAKDTLQSCAASAQLYADQFPRSAGGELHATVAKECAKQRAYIKQRWGY